MTNTLVSPSDLDPFPGSPFDAALVDSAAASIRGDAGWHIAPQVTETLTVDSYGGQVLFLPTRRIVAVTAIRDVRTGTPAALTDWTRLATGIYRRAGWPIGAVEVDLTHGYADVPADLLPVIADRVRNTSNPRDPSLSAKTVGAVAESYRDTGSVATVDPVLARYSVIGGVA